MKSIRFKMTILILMFIVLASSAVSVYAHPGKTDSSGGHYDSSTGTYHYHHGFSAHQHRDTDGDGVVECPYGFEDRTGENSESSSNKSSGKGTSENMNNYRLLAILLLGSFVAVVIIVVLAIALRKKCDKFNTLSAWLSNSKSEAAELRCSLKQNTEDAKYCCELLYGGKTRAEITNAPAGSFVGADELPCTKVGIDSLHKWGKYTVFFATNGTCYHCLYGCSGAILSKNVVHAEKRLKPCLKCAYRGFDLAWYYRYKRAMELIKKYSIEIKE